MKRLKTVVLSDFLNDLPLGAFITYAYWYIYHQTHNQSIVSLLGTASTLATLLAIIGGYISDQYSKIKLMRFIIFARLIFLIFAFALIGLTHIQLAYVICMIVIFNSILNIVYNPLTEAIAPSLIEDDELLIKANSWVALANNIATIVSSGLAAVFVAFKKPMISMIILSVSVVVSLIALSFIQADPAPRNPEAVNLKNIWNGFVEGLKLVCKNKLIVIMIPIAIIVNFCFYVIWLLMPNFAVNIFSRYEFMYNGIDIVYTLGGILGALIFSHIKNNVKSQILCPACLTFQAVALVIVGFCSLVPNNIASAITCLASWLAYGLFNSIFSIVYFSIVQMSASKDRTGMVIGAVMTIFSIINPIATAMSAPLSNIWKLSTLIICLGIIMVVTLAMTFLPLYQQVFKKYDKIYN